MRVAVTGASGHVGGNLVRALLARGDQVRVLLRADDRAVRGLEIERIPGDLLAPETLTPLVDRAEVVFHAAAEVSISGDRDGCLARVNVLGTRHIAAASRAAGVRRLVHFSSIHALESPAAERPIDEARPYVSEVGAPAYDRSKAAGEREVLAAAERGLAAVILQPTAIVGPFDFKPSHTGRLIVALARRRMPALVAGGFDWVDVRDIASAALTAGDRGRPGARYLVSGHWLPVAELAGEVAHATGVPAPRIVAPFWVARLGVPFVTLYARLLRRSALYTAESLRALRLSRRVDGAKARRELGHAPRPFAETIRDSVGWLRDHGYLTGD
ncbi:MAG: NAD-dependent epimerase/dehydratase family protein [Thermoanaerobaculia bacterium]